MKIKNVIGSTLKKAPSHNYIESFKLLIRGGFVKVSTDNSLVLSVTGIRSMEKLIMKISRIFINFQPFKIYSSNKIETALEYLNSEIQSYRQLPSTSRFANYKINREFFLKQGLIYPNISETLNFIATTESKNYKKEDTEELLKIIIELFQSLNVTVVQFNAINSLNQYEINLENKELAVLCEDGIEQYVICNKCNYHSRIEVASFVKEVKKDDEIEMQSEVYTPGTNTIASLAKFLDIEESQCAKVVFYSHKLKNKLNIVVVILRGDMEVSVEKLKMILQADQLEFASNTELISINAVPGYASAIGINRENCTVIVDDLIPESTNLVTGANKLDFHLINTNYGRDYEADMVVDIALAQDNYLCQVCQSKFSFVKGIQLYYSSFYKQTEKINYLDNKGKPQQSDIRISIFDLTKIFGVLAMITDKFGVILPPDISPFQFVLMTIGSSEEVTKLSNGIYSDLINQYDILFDNRDVKIGVKLADADLRSIPYRLIISQKTLETREIEFLIRGSKDKNFFPADDLETVMKSFILKN